MSSSRRRLRQVELFTRMKYSARMNLFEQLSSLDGDEECSSLPVASLRSYIEFKRGELGAHAELIDLSMINPDIPPSRFLLDKLLEASMKPGAHRYSVSRGVRKLRAAFSEKYRTAFGVELDPENEVCVTMGAKEALVHTLRCIGKAEQRALVGGPVYPAHHAALTLAGISYDTFPISVDQNEMVESIRRAWQSGAYSILLLSFPNNPTGVAVDPAFYDQLYALMSGRPSWLINDFVYGEMGYSDTQGSSALVAAPRKRSGDDRLRVVEIYSLSKAYSVPGWRVGALVGDSEVVQLLGRLKSQVDYGIFLPIQEAASAALCSDEDLVAPVVEEYSKRASVLVSGLERAGWAVWAPRAGASVWSRLPEEVGRLGSLQAAQRLLRSTGIAALPGIVFGEEFDSYLRFALVAPEARLRSVVERVSDWTLEETVSKRCA